VKSTSFVPGLAWLLICQSIGEALSRWSHVGLPGPVIGMMLMLGLLGWEPVRAQVTAVVFRALLRRAEEAATS